MNKTAARAATLRALFVALVVASLFYPGISRANGQVITGIVRDKLDAPIVGATVSDGSQSTLTDSSGRYTLVETNPATYTITASRNGYVSDSKRVGTLTNLADVNFSLLFEISASLSPRYFNVVPQDLTATVSSLAPANTAFVANFPGGFFLTLVHQGTSESMNNWNAIRNIDAGSTDGAYNVTFQGKVSGTTVTPLRTLTYFLDRASPVFSSPSAAPNGTDTLATRSASPVLSMTATDPLSGVEPTSVTATVKDSGGNVLSAGIGTYISNRITYQVPSFTPLADGSYNATFGATDRAGSSSTSATISFTFVVDTAKPTVLDPAPNDEITTVNPEVSVKIDDPGPAALDPPSMWLDGIRVAATYDAASLRFSYTPIIPLLPGKHLVVTSATDAAGNSQSLGWHFWALHRLLDDYE